MTHVLAPAHRRPVLSLTVAAGAVLAPVRPPRRRDEAATSRSATRTRRGSAPGSYYADSGSCKRLAVRLPGARRGPRRGRRCRSQACSGATTSSVLPEPARHAHRRDLVSSPISVGGNDAGFSSVLTECAQPWWASDCNGAIDQAQAIIRNTLPGRLDALYGAIRSRAATAKVVVVGYPRIFNGEDCNAATFFSPARGGPGSTRPPTCSTPRSASARPPHGFSFVDPRTAFTGHAVCDSPEWINGLSNPIAESYHPNRTGQSSGYAALVDDYLTYRLVRTSPVQPVSSHRVTRR